MTMTKKSSTEVNGRRESIIDKDNKAIVDDHSKYSTQHEPMTNKTNYDELKAQVSTPEEMRDLVRRLPLDAVLPLLSELLEKFNGSRDTQVIIWLKTMVLIHTGYFMTLPEVVKKLSALYKSLNLDLALYPKLLSMRGRLDLVQGQIDARYRQNDDASDMEQDDEDEGMGQEAYNESESSDDDDDDDDDDNDDDDDDDELLSDEDVEVNTTEMFAEEEEDLNTEDEDASDSDIEEE